MGRCGARKFLDEMGGRARNLNSQDTEDEGKQWKITLYSHRFSIQGFRLSEWQNSLDSNLTGQPASGTVGTRRVQYVRQKAWIMTVRMGIATNRLLLVLGLSLGPASFGQDRPSVGAALVPSQRVPIDFSQLPGAVRGRLRQLDDKYSAAERKFFKAPAAAVVEAMGNSKMVRGPHEQMLYRHDLLKTVFFRNEAGDGFDLSYYANGCINSYVEYKAEKVHGAVAKFHDNGKLRCYLECRDGNLVGAAEQWDDSGMPLGAIEVQSPREFIVNLSTNN